MAAGTVQLFHSAYTTLFQTVAGGGLRQWDNTAAGNVFFYLCTDTPTDTDTTVADITAMTGDGAPVASGATTLTVTAGTGADAGKTFFDSADITWGATTTITGARYMVCAMPQTANSAASTDELLFYVALNTSSPNTVSSSGGEFTVNAPTDGWFYLNQA